MKNNIRVVFLIILAFSIAIYSLYTSYSVLTSDVPTVAVMATFIANNNLDQDTVYKFTKALFDEKANIIHQKAALLDNATAIHGISIPLHKGAEKYYREQGILN